MAVLKKGDKVLVTGATGYIGSHVVYELIAAGYKVRGTSRNLEQGQFLVDLIAKNFGQSCFELVYVPDMLAAGAYDEALEGVSGIVHLASIVTFSAVAEEVVPPTIRGTLNIFDAAMRSSSVKSLVVTSSTAAAIMPVPNRKSVVTQDTWNNESVEQTHNNPEAGAYHIYAASKAEAEKTLWDAVKTSNPKFQVSTILPNTNVGTRFKQTGNSSCELFIGIYTGKHKALLSVPPQYYINTSDDAKLHVIALTDLVCDRQRIFACAAPFNYNDVVHTLRKLEPTRDFGGDVETGSDLSEMPNRFAQEILVKHYGHGFTSLEASLKQAIGPDLS